MRLFSFITLKTDLMSLLEGEHGTATAEFAIFVPLFVFSALMTLPPEVPSV